MNPPEPPLGFAVNEIDVAQADALVIVTVGLELIVPVTGARAPSHSLIVHDTKKVVVVVRFGEKVDPVLTTLPPDAASYHVNVPPSQPLADKLTTPGSHLAAPVVVGAGGV